MVGTAKMPTMSLASLDLSGGRHHEKMLNQEKGAQRKKEAAAQMLHV